MSPVSDPTVLIRGAVVDGTTALKNISEVRKANAERRLLSDVRKELPGRVESEKRITNSYLQLNQTRMASAHETTATMAAYKSVAGEAKVAIEAVTATTEEVARSAETVGQAARVFTEEVKGIRVIGKSYVDTAAYHTKFMQTATTAALGVMVKVHQELEGIKEELKGIRAELNWLNSNKLKGAGGPDGFARWVYDFVAMRVLQTATAPEKHRFFVYHPYTF